MYTRFNLRFSFPLNKSGFPFRFVSYFYRGDRKTILKRG